MSKSILVLWYDTNVSRMLYDYHFHSLIYNYYKIYATILYMYVQDSLSSTGSGLEEEKELEMLNDDSEESDEVNEQGANFDNNEGASSEDDF